MDFVRVLGGVWEPKMLDFRILSDIFSIQIDVNLKLTKMTAKCVPRAAKPLCAPPTPPKTHMAEVFGFSGEGKVRGGVN